MSKRVIAFINLFVFTTQFCYAGSQQQKNQYRNSFERKMNYTANALLASVIDKAHLRVSAGIKDPKKIQESFDTFFRDKTNGRKLAMLHGALKTLAVKKKGNSLVLTGPGHKTTIEFEKIFLGEIGINGNFVSMALAKENKAALLDKLLKAAAPRTSASFLDFSIIPSAHAEFVIAAIIVAAIVAALWEIVTGVESRAEAKEQYQELKKKVQATIDQCQGDLEDTKSKRKYSKLDTETSFFRQYLEYQRFNRSYDQPEILSCENLEKAPGVKATSFFFRTVWDQTEEVCALQKQLEACIEETDRVIAQKELRVYDGEKAKDSLPESSPYKILVNPAGSGARSN